MARNRVLVLAERSGDRVGGESNRSLTAGERRRHGWAPGTWNDGGVEW